MDLSDTPASTIRHDGWTAARKARFLESLAGDGNVSAACARAGLSREAAYRLRRRDALFARAWAAAQVQARETVGEVLGTRAIDGIEEQVWFRGEVVGTRRRYDTRLLLAHIARLDKLAEDERVVEDAARFDELLACIAGEPVPEELALGDGELPVDRATCALMKAELAQEDAPEGEAEEAYRRGRAEGEALWDAWFAGACDTVDRLLAEPAAQAVSTLSNLSTSALACALLARNPRPGVSSPERGGGPPAGWGSGTLGQSPPVPLPHASHGSPLRSGGDNQSVSANT